MGIGCCSRCEKPAFPRTAPPVHRSRVLPLFLSRGRRNIQFSGNVLQIEQFCEAKTEPAQERARSRPVPSWEREARECRPGWREEAETDVLPEAFSACSLFPLRQIEGRVQLVGINFNLGEAVQQRFGFSSRFSGKAESSQPLRWRRRSNADPAGAYLARAVWLAGGFPHLVLCQLFGRQSPQHGLVQPPYGKL